MPDSPPPIRPPVELRVLYVDDEAFLRLVMSTYLQQMGCTVEVACDGQEGWEKCSQSVFDLVITDLEMPKLNGIGLIRRLREARQPVRIIVHSSALTPANLARLQDLAVDATLPKGTLAGVLRATIERVARLPS